MLFLNTYNYLQLKRFGPTRYVKTDKLRHRTFELLITKLVVRIL